MIPPFGHSGALPPYLPGANPAADPTCISPYETDLVEIVTRFGTSARRRELLQGLLRMRAQLASVGVVSGFQWIDGSFTEDIETTDGRDPGDIDVVTFASLPADSNKEVLLNSCGYLFNPDEAKSTYGCHAFFVDMSMSPELVHEHTCYWLSLFSHRRATHLWKGMLKIAVPSNDDEAKKLLGGF